MNESVGGEEMRVGRQTVRFTRPEKLLFPDDDIDKRELADYYARVASTMLPYLHDRPVAMERFPEPDRYTVRTIFGRLRRTGDMWKEIGRQAQALPRTRVH